MREIDSLQPHDSRTVLQGLLQSQKIPHKVIREALSLERTTVRKWALGELFPHRPNAKKLIELFNKHGIELDYNDIYQDERKAS